MMKKEWINFFGSKVSGDELANSVAILERCDVISPPDLLTSAVNPEFLKKLNNLPPNKVSHLKNSFHKIGFRNLQSLTCQEVSSALRSAGIIDDAWVKRLNNLNFDGKTILSKDVRTLTGPDAFSLIDQAKKALKLVRGWSLLGIPPAGARNPQLVNKVPDADILKRQESNDGKLSVEKQALASSNAPVRPAPAFPPTKKSVGRISMMSSDDESNRVHVKPRDKVKRRRDEDDDEYGEEEEGFRLPNKLHKKATISGSDDSDGDYKPKRDHKSPDNNHAATTDDSRGCHHHGRYYSSASIEYKVLKGIESGQYNSSKYPGILSKLGWKWAEYHGKSVYLPPWRVSELLKPKAPHMNSDSHRETHSLKGYKLNEDYFLERRQVLNYIMEHGFDAPVRSAPVERPSLAATASKKDQPLPLPPPRPSGGARNKWVITPPRVKPPRMPDDDEDEGDSPVDLTADSAPPPVTRGKSPSIRADAERQGRARMARGGGIYIHDSPPKTHPPKLSTPSTPQAPKLSTPPTPQAPELSTPAPKLSHPQTSPKEMNIPKPSTRPDTSALSILEQKRQFLQTCGREDFMLAYQLISRGMRKIKHTLPAAPACEFSVEDFRSF